MGIKRMGTFITVPREIFDDGLFVHEPYSRREAFLDLVQKAVHEETVLPVRGGSITLNRGEVFASIRYLATRWGWSKSKVEAVLKEFISMNLVGHKSDTSNSTLSIVNYDLYQRPVDTCKDENGDTCKDAKRDKDNKDKEHKELKEKSNADALPERTEGRKLTSNDVMNLWNTICVRCKKVVTMNESRAEKVRLRLKEMGSDEMVTTLFRKINESDFLCLGSNSKDHPDWTVSFDWVFKNDKNWVRIIEGNYDNKRKGLLPLQEEWRVKGRVYYKSDFVGHEDEYNSLDPPEKNRLKMGKGIVWMGEYWKRDDF